MHSTLDYEIDDRGLSFSDYTFTIRRHPSNDTDAEGDVNIAHRLNSDLAGSWSGVLTEDDGSQGLIELLTFVTTSLGVEELVWPSDSSNEAITWLSTSTEIAMILQRLCV